MKENIVIVWTLISFLSPSGKGADNVNSYLIWVILSLCPFPSNPVPKPTENSSQVFFLLKQN